MEKELQKIGQRIKILRIENKISQKVLAKKLFTERLKINTSIVGRKLIFHEKNK